MRFSRVAGVALIAAGAAVLVWGGRFTSPRDVVEIRGSSVSTEQRPPIARWTIAAVLIAGVTLIVIDMRRKT